MAKRAAHNDHRHLVEYETDKLGRPALLCSGRVVRGEEWFVANRETFEGLSTKHQCSTCKSKLTAYKVRLLAEVIEIESRTP